MKKLLIFFILVLGVFSIADAKTLFIDDFEGKVKGDWGFTDAEGKGVWEVAKVDGRGVFMVTSIGAWTGACVDGVASIKNYDEI